MRIVLLHRGAGAIGKSIDSGRDQVHGATEQSEFMGYSQLSLESCGRRYLAISLEPQKYFATTKHSRRLIVRKLMKNLLPLLFAVVLGVACFVPVPASAYYYHGRYYRYSYRGHYYPYRYHGHYYRHRAWRGGYYRYW